ncbi:MAG: hypothetical protein AMXMBFR84_31630 [Candidatus Hydrogenedentota bacterium]
MRIVLIGVGLVAALVVTLAVVIATRPSEIHIERSTTMAASPEAIFEQISNFHNWAAWSPWDKIDPALERTYAGAESGEGATYAWKGNSQVGEGKMTIVESKPNESIKIKLEFFKPMAGVSESGFILKPEGDQTNVTWTYDGTNNFIAKAIGLFMSMDSMIGGSYEQGLAEMKRIVEAKPQ